VATNDLEFKIGADVSELVKAVDKVEAAFKDLSSQFKSLGTGGGVFTKTRQELDGVGSSATAAGRKAETSFNRVQSSLAQTGRASQNASQQINRNFQAVEATLTRVGGAVAAFFGAQAATSAARSIIETADAYQNLSARLSLFVDDAEQLTRVQDELFEQSQRSATDLSSTIELYGRFAQATRGLGVGQEQLLQVTETIGQTIAISGSSAQAAEAALVQLGQGIASGVLRGEELNSILEQTPALAQAIADGLGRPIGELRALGAEGALTADVVLGALINVSGQVQQQFDRLPNSVGLSLTRLRNEVNRTIAETDLSPLSESIDNLRQTLSDPAVVEGLQSMAGAFVSITAAAVEASAAIGNFATFLGEELASAVHGPALDDIPRLMREIEDIERSISNLERNRRASASIGGRARINELRKQLEVYQSAIKKAREQAADAGSAGEDIELPAVVPPTSGPVEAREYADQIADVIRSLEEEAATFGKSASEVIAYRLGLMGATDEEIRLVTALQDSISALEARGQAQTESVRLAEEQAKQLAAIRQRIAAQEGRSIDARRISLENQYADLRRNLEIQGDEAGVALIDNLFNVELGQARLDDLKNRYRETLDTLRDAEGRVSDSVRSGDTTREQGKSDLQATRTQASEELAILREDFIRLDEEGVSGATDAIREIDQALRDLNEQTLTGSALAVAELNAEVENLQDNLASSVAKSLISSMTGFFTDLVDGSKSAGEALSDFAKSFLNAMVQIAAQALATFAVLQLLNTFFPGAGQAVAASSGAAGVFHSGGVVGRGSTFRRLDSSIFAYAPRYHSGGIVGLSSNEVPAVLEVGEEVLTASDPRHRDNLSKNSTNSSQSASSESSTRIVNVIDPNLVQDYLTSSSGEKTILNVIQRNKGLIKQTVR